MSVAELPVDTEPYIYWSLYASQQLQQRRPLNAAAAAAANEVVDLD